MADHNWPAKCQIIGCNQPPSSFDGRKVCRWHLLLHNPDEQEAVNQGVKHYAAAIKAWRHLTLARSGIELNRALGRCHELEWPELRPGSDEHYVIYLTRLSWDLLKLVKSYQGGGQYEDQA